MYNSIEIEPVNFLLEKRINTRNNPANSVSMMKNNNPARKNLSENNLFIHFTIFYFPLS